MYKLVAIDLDGTMLNSYGAVTEKTRNTIKKCIEKGTDVIIASGRPIDSIKTIAKEIGSEKYFIAGNGAMIYDIQKDEVIYEKGKFYETSLFKAIVDEIIRGEVEYLIIIDRDVFYPSIFTIFFQLIENTDTKLMIISELI